MRQLFALLFIVNLSCSIAQETFIQDVEIDSARRFEIANEGQTVNTLFDVPETEGKIASGLCVNGDTLRSILFSKGELKGNTLQILIHQTDPGYHHKFLIMVRNGKYHLTYEYLTSGEQAKRKIVLKESKLVLNTLDFLKQSEVRGYVEYRGKCIEGCNEKIILIKGNFKVIIN